MGLRLEIILEDTNLVFRQLDSVNKNNRTTLNPRFHSLNGSSTPNTWTNGGTAKEFYVDRSNHNIGVENFPFVVGETIRFANTTNINHLGKVNASDYIYYWNFCQFNS